MVSIAACMRCHLLLISPAASTAHLLLTTHLLLVSPAAGTTHALLVSPAASTTHPLLKPWSPETLKTSNPDTINAAGDTGRKIDTRGQTVLASRH